MKKPGVRFISILCALLLAGMLAGQSLAVAAAATPPIIVTESLPGGNVNIPYAQPLTASGGSNIFASWSIIDGALPDGLAVVPTNGIIDGTPTKAGTFTFTVQVYDSTSTTATKSLTIVIAGPITTPPGITTTSLPAGMVGTAYSQVLAASGGSGAYTAWAVTSGVLPGGLFLASATGVISGTPTAAGTFTFIVQVTDSSGATDTQSLSIVIAAVPATPSITNTSLPGGRVNVAYSQALAASGGSGTYTAWAVTSGAFPGGLSLASATGVISGTPTAAGTFAFTVQVTDSSGATATRPLTIVVSAANPGGYPIIITTSLPNGKVNTPYAQPLTASGGSNIFASWSIISGDLPDGLEIVPTNGIIDGIPTVAGTFTFTVQVYDSTSTTATLSLTIVITA